MYSIQKEISQKEADEYGTFGNPYFVTKEMVDPVDCCLPGHFMNCPKTSDLGLCPTYMAQRCAEKWDDKCNLYANTINDEEKSKDFFRETLGRKFCKLDPNSECSTKCQPFDPVSQQSPFVCSDIGNEVLKNSKNNIDVGWYKPINISPDYMGSCKKKCDITRPEDIELEDPVINTCLRYGFCNDILSNVCSHSTGGEFKNKYLGEYCDWVKTQPKKEKPLVLQSSLDDVPKMKNLRNFQSDNITDTTNTVQDSSVVNPTLPPTKTKQSKWLNCSISYISFSIILLLICYLIYELYKNKN